MKVVGESASAAGGLRQAGRLRPDVIIVDLPYSEVDITADDVAEIIDLHGSAVLILDTTATRERFEGAAEEVECISRHARPAEIEAAVVRLAQRTRHGTVMSTSSARSARFSKGIRVTDRELDVLSLVAAGLSNRELAAKLHITEVTVKFHMTNLFRKFGAVRRTELVYLATKAGLLWGASA
ncbi:DNA-binding response regulator [Pseudonocardia sulfidoxydans NBRC 16205]|uniref:DNA-binding response regulator n=2 Tax=Pseudonocardia sulfidoxydans TaxID=54011 RepID=A0A511DR39_9PSEU|nr:DNA-binding response regulator [Pseudonocardia sulfidoxydans NBRC 16205]